MSEERSRRIAAALVKASGHYLGLHESAKLAPLIEAAIEKALNVASDTDGQHRDGWNAALAVLEG